MVDETNRVILEADQLDSRSPLPRWRRIGTRVALARPVEAVERGKSFLMAPDVELPPLPPMTGVPRGNSTLPDL